MTNTKTLTHLSLTGYYAGVRLCGISKTDGPNALHATYAPMGDKKPASIEYCPECMKAWEDSANDD